jgi:hypothetical protein
MYVYIFIVAFSRQALEGLSMGAAAGRRSLATSSFKTHYNAAAATPFQVTPAKHNEICCDVILI